MASCIQHASAVAFDGAVLEEDYPFVVGTGVKLEVRPGRVKAQPKVIMPPGPVVPRVIFPKATEWFSGPPVAITIPPLRVAAKKMPKQPTVKPPPHLIRSDEAENEGKQDLQIVISLI